MPLYVFDLNEGDSPEWEDEELDCEGRADIERHARKMIAEASARLAARSIENIPSTVVVSDPDGKIIMSAHGCGDGSLRILWRQSKTSTPVAARQVRAHARGILLHLVERLDELNRDET